MADILPYSFPPDMNLLSPREQKRHLKKTTAQLERYSEAAETVATSFMEKANFIAATADTMTPGSPGRRQEVRNAVDLLDAAGRTAVLIMKACAMRRGGAPLVPEVINATQHNYYDAKRTREAHTYVDANLSID